MLSTYLYEHNVEVMLVKNKLTNKHATLTTILFGMVLKLLSCNNNLNKGKYTKYSVYLHAFTGVSSCEEVHVGDLW